MKQRKIILHLCADLGSDSLFYQRSEDYEVIMIALENPFNGRLKEIIGSPQYVYQPWEFGSPWTKKTAIWGKFNKPQKVFTDWDDVPKNQLLYIRPGRKKPGLVYFHKSAIDLIPEMQWAKKHIKCDADIRSMCSQGFAYQFFLSNK